MPLTPLARTVRSAHTGAAISRFHSWSVRPGRVRPWLAHWLISAR
ncbi:hypothetical protein [Streptomyces vilmorinianum]|nr:hypothetical protein [Streptomyces vilmorinianum]